MADELAAVQAFLDTRLKADAALTALVGSRIYADVAPEGTDAVPTVYPLVVYHQQTGSDLKNIQGEAAFASFLFYVRPISTQGYAELSAILLRIEAAIGGLNNALIVTGGHTYNLKCTRHHLRNHRPELANGVLYRSRGAFYRILVEVIA